MEMLRIPQIEEELATMKTLTSTKDEVAFLENSIETHFVRKTQHEKLQQAVSFNENSIDQNQTAIYKNKMEI